MSISNTTTDGFRTAGIPVLLIVSTFVLQIFFFAPLQALSQNFGEFSVDFIDVLIICLVVSFALIVLLYFSMRILKLPVLLSTLTLLSLVAFLESRFFLGLARHNPFDGKPIDWDVLQRFSYFELVVIVALGVLFVAIRRRTKLLSHVSLFILIFLSAGFFHGITSNFEALAPGGQNSRTDSTYIDQFYRLSEQRNVIHIVPDKAQGAMLHDILASDSERYSGVFDGFTLFTQAVGRYEGTYPSVLFYMAGVAPEPEHDLVLNQPYPWEFVEETLTERSIISLLSQNEFKTYGFQFHPGIFCRGPYTACTGTHDEVFGGMAVETPGRRLTITALTALDLGLFQMTPIALREQIHDKGRWFTKKLVKGAATHAGILDVFNSKMKVDENPGTYNYFHMAGAHAPLLFDRTCTYVGPQPINWQNQSEQVTCTLAQLEKMIVTLKKHGVYDQTMIVINGDHGIPWIPPSLPTRSGKLISTRLMGLASTLLLVKPPETRGPLSFSDQPVTIGDIPATIASAMGLESTFPGIQMFGGEFSADRERDFYAYDSASKAHNLQALPNLTRYRIRGNVFNEHEWVLPNSVAPGENLSQLRMDHEDFLAYSQGFSDLEQHNTPMRWVDGKQAQVYLYPPSQGAVALVIDSFVPSSIEGQWMEISIEGRVITRLNATDLTERRHIIPVPEDLARMEVLEIEFKMGKTLHAENDERRLSVLFGYIGLEPTG